MVDWKEHIVSNPKIMMGKPVIKGTRISVELIPEKLSDGESLKQILEEHPHLTHENIMACLSYAKDSLNNEIIYQLVS